MHPFLNRHRQSLNNCDSILAHSLLGSAAGLLYLRSIPHITLQQLQRRVPQDPENQLPPRTHVNLTEDKHAAGAPATLATCELEPLLAGLGEVLRENETADLAAANIRRWTFAPAPMQATRRQTMNINTYSRARGLLLLRTQP